VWLAGVAGCLVPVAGADESWFPPSSEAPSSELARGPSADLPSLSGTAPLPLASDSGVAAVVLLGLVVDEGRKVIVFVIHQPLSASRWCLVVWQKGTCTTNEL
jgi:hypothetical protein